MKDYKEKITLIGGYVARMNMAETNAWGDFCQNCPEYLTLHTLRGELNAYIASGDANIIGSMTEAVINAEMVFRTISRDWVNENVEPDPTPEQVEAEVQKLLDDTSDDILDDMETEDA